MTSPSRRSNSEREDDIVVISTSSSEDEGEQILSLIQDTLTDRRTIRELVYEGIRILSLAEIKSRPEDYRTNAVPMFRYNFSSDVTGNDLFLETDFAELSNIVSVLKTRLSAERVFSLGCPQLRSERDVFDELLMRYSDELLEIRQETNPAFHTSEIINTGTLPNNESVGASSSSVIDSHSNNPITLKHLNCLVQNLNTFLTNVLADSLEGNVSELQNGHHSRDTSEQQNSEVSTNSLLSKNGHSLKDIHNLAFQEFLKNVNQLNSLISQTNRISVSEPSNSCDSKINRALQAHQSLLSSVMRLYPTDSSISQSDLSTPKQCKRRRSEDGSETVKRPKTKDVDSKHEEEDKEEDSCSICLEPWSTGGDHRVTCLKCGHLFGKSCILKWIEQAHCCPQCKEGAKKKDVRNIFVPKITAEDTSQRDRALRLLEEEKLTRRNFEQREAMARKKLEMQEAVIDSLKAEVNQYKTQLTDNQIFCGQQSQTQALPRPTSSTSSSQSVSSNKRFHQFQKVSISTEGQCRVFDQCKVNGLVVVSMKSTNTLFKGFGVRVLTRDFRPLSYQPLHSAAIRDMCFRPGSLDSMLLSCGLDKSLQLTSVTNQVVIQKYTVNSSAWCCTWNTQNNNLFYAGMERGVVKEFDIRRTDSHVQDLLNYGGSPINSIHYWNGSVNEVSLTGLLIAHLQSLIFGEQVNGQLTTHELPHLQASLISLSLHHSGMYLSSFRPGNHFPRSRHELCSLKLNNTEDDGISTKTVSSSCQATWDGSNMQAVISRNSLITRPETEDSLLAVTANHCNNTVSVYDCSKKQDFQTLQCFNKAIDIKLLSGDQLAVLTDKNLLLYNWRT